MSCRLSRESDNTRKYLTDRELDSHLRAYLSEFLTPRRALDDSLIWPVDELYDDSYEEARCARKTNEPR